MSTFHFSLYIFVFVQEKPFVFVKQSKSGKKTYSGLCIDLLNKLQEEMKFRYTIEESPCNVYGAPDVFTGEWSGMVRYLIDNVSVTLFLLTLYYKVCSPKERKSRLLMPLFFQCMLRAISQSHDRASD